MNVSYKEYVEKCVENSYNVMGLAAWHHLAPTEQAEMFSFVSQKQDVAKENHGSAVEANAIDNSPSDSLYKLSDTKKARYPHASYDGLVEETFKRITELGIKKGGEYAGDDDRLENFRRNGNNLGLPMETVWAVYAGKHWDAIMQFVKDQRNGTKRDRMEPIDGRVDDLIVYLLLFKAMLDERGYL